MSTCWTAFQDWLTLRIELGVGDSNAATTTGKWGTSKWGDAAAKWSGLEPTWLDVTERMLDVNVQRGRARWTERIGMGGAQIAADNADGWLDWNSSALGYVDARPGVQLRVRAYVVADATTHDIWRGY